MSRKIARITQEKKLLLANEVVESNTKTSLNSDGRLEVDEIIEYPAELEGGRNLLRNSASLTEWRTYGNVDILDNDGTFNPTMAKIARVSTRNWGAEIKGVPTSLGDVWSFSFIARKGTSDGDIRAALMGRTIDGRHLGNWTPRIEKVYDLPNGWALYKGENCIMNREEVAYISIRFFNAGQTNDGYHDYALPKLEKGNKATPWTPAPEDITETYIINHNTPFVENNTVHSLKLYNRALTDEEILQNYRAGYEWTPQIGEREVISTMKPIITSLSRKGKGKRELISTMKPITTGLERKGKGKREVISTMKPITSSLSRKGVGRREVTTTVKPITSSISKKLPPIHVDMDIRERTPNITTRERIPKLEVLNNDIYKR